MTTIPDSSLMLCAGAPPLAYKGGSFFTLLGVLCTSAFLRDILFPFPLLRALCVLCVEIPLSRVLA